MQKDFDKWGEAKIEVNKKVVDFHVHERDIWWFSAGLNIGSEIDGKSDLFERPCIVFKVHNSNTATVIPISTNKEEKKEEYYSFNFLFNEVSQIAVLSQSKLIDFKRCSRYIGRIEQGDFKKLKEKFIKYFQYETPLARGISGAEAISNKSIASPQNLSSGRVVERKVNTVFFDIILSGKKKFETRLGDLDIKEGDTLLLREVKDNEYTGREISKKVLYTKYFKVQDYHWSMEEILDKGLVTISFD